MGLFLKNPDLLIPFRRGDRQAFEKIYKEYVDEVSLLVRLGFVYSRDKVLVVRGIRDASVQCDLIQETFARCFSKTARQRFDVRKPFRPYLLRITKNLMIDRLRKLGRELPESKLEEAQGLDDIDALLEENRAFTKSNPSEDAHFIRQQKATQEFVESIVEEQRVLYGLRYTQGLSQQKVAQGMGISRRRVRTLENRLRKGLKRFLKNRKLWP